MFLSLSLPAALLRPYRILRFLLWLIVLLVVGSLFFDMVFPDSFSSFSFDTPNSSKNTLFDPRLTIGESRINGKLAPTETFLINAGFSGDYETAHIRAALEGKSALTGRIDATLGRSYRAFLLPTGPPLTEPPRETLIRANDQYYALREGVLFPFVSDAAYKSRYPETWADEKTAEWLQQFPVSETFIGFRVGSLLSFADGVFLVVDESEIRPVGSAEVFLALGYRFEDVRPVSEEDLGIYRRGRIIALSFVHPSGTLFLDEDTKTTYLIENGTKRAIDDEAYLRFLTERQTPILASSRGAETLVRCTLTPGFFARSLSCSTSVTELSLLPGGDLSLTLSSPDQAIDLNSLSVTMKTRKSTVNALRFGSILKQRILENLGLGV